MIDRKEVVGLDSDGAEVKVYVRKPEAKDMRGSKVAYNKALREALDDGAMLKAKLQTFVMEQGIWTDAKEEKYQNLIKEIHALEEVLKRGNIPLTKAKETALKLHGVREDFKELISERQSYDVNSAESQADNASFNYLVTCCVENAGGQRVWNSVEEYDKVAFQPWAIMAASELAKMLYGLDPDYDKNLVENQFLIKYKFVNKDLKLVNKEGHLIDNEGRLINDEGRFVAYREDKTQYFVDKEGNEVDKDGNKIIPFSPFLDDEGNPILDEEEKESTTNS